MNLPRFVLLGNFYFFTGNYFLFVLNAVLAHIFQVQRQRVLDIFPHFFHSLALGQYAGNLFELPNKLGTALANKQGELHDLASIMRLR